MKTAFGNILVPVNFGPDTELCTEKALELADAGSCVHLLHVLKPSFMDMIRWEAEDSVQVSMDRLAGKLKALKEDIRICTSIVPGKSIQGTIAGFASGEQCDLVVISRKAGRLPFFNKINASAIAACSGAAVMTIRHSKRAGFIRTMVVTLDGSVSFKKLEAVQALCTRWKFKIHLVTFMEGETPEQDAGNLFKTYQWVQQALHCPVEYAVLQGNRKQKAVIAYAHRVGADVLVVQQAETSSYRDQWKLLESNYSVFTI